MKIIRFIDENGTQRIGSDLSDGTAEIMKGDLFDSLRLSGQKVSILKLLTPVSPPNIFGIGLNYREHVRQMGAELPEHPVVFMKPTTSIANPDDPIFLPKCCTNGPEVDYEAELAVVIGKTARDVSRAEALIYVLGYTAANELSARKWAKVSRTRGKCFDSFCVAVPSRRPTRSASRLFDRVLRDLARQRDRLGGRVTCDLALAVYVEGHRVWGRSLVMPTTLSIGIEDR